MSPRMFKTQQFQSPVATERNFTHTAREALADIASQFAAASSPFSIAHHRRQSRHTYRTADTKGEAAPAHLCCEANRHHILQHRFPIHSVLVRG